MGVRWWPWLWVAWEVASGVRVGVARVQRVMFTPNELVFSFGGFYDCANFGENRSRNATVRVRTDGQTDRQTQRGKPVS